MSESEDSERPASPIVSITDENLDGNAARKEFNELNKELHGLQQIMDAANSNTELIRALFAKHLHPRFRERQQLELQFAKGLEEVLFRIKFSRTEQSEIEAVITAICVETDLEDISDSQNRLFISRSLPTTKSFTRA